MTYLDPLNPPAVPPDMTKVAGCTCRGGLQFHELDCGLFDLPRNEAIQAIADANSRLRAHTEDLNRRLTEQLGRVR